MKKTLRQKEAANELLRRRKSRNNLLDFCQYTMEDYQISPHLIVLIEKLEAIERGEIKRLIVIMPPRHGKSELVSVRFPCWYLARRPEEFIVQCGYSESIALVHSRKARDVFISVEMNTLFPEIAYRPERASQEIIIPQRQAAQEWGTKQSGSYYAVGVGGGLTGRGFNLGLIDDPVKGYEDAQSETIREKTWEWYKSVFRTRVAPDAAIIIIMTRWHQDDLVGMLLQQAHDNPEADQWEVLHMPAISEDGKALWSERYPAEILNEVKNTIGARAFESLYQGRPVIASGQIFKREWWKYYDERPIFVRVVHSWDTAFKEGVHNDFSVCTVWGETDESFYLLDVWRGRVEFPELKRVAEALACRDTPNIILVEDKASGQSLVQELQRNTKLPILPIQVDRDKIARAESATPLIEAGKVKLPKYADWLYDFLEEVSAFPNAKYDDQVDSVTQALEYLRRRIDQDALVWYDAINDVRLDF